MSQTLSINHRHTGITKVTKVTKKGLGLAKKKITSSSVSMRVVATANPLQVLKLEDRCTGPNLLIPQSFYTVTSTAE